MEPGELLGVSSRGYGCRIGDAMLGKRSACRDLFLETFLKLLWGGKAGFPNGKRPPALWLGDDGTVRAGTPCIRNYLPSR